MTDDSTGLHEAFERYLMMTSTERNRPILRGGIGHPEEEWVGFEAGYAAAAARIQDLETIVALDENIMRECSEENARLRALLAESQAALAKVSRDLMEMSLEARRLGNQSADLLDWKRRASGQDALAQHAIIELHLLGYTIKNGLLYPPYQPAAKANATQETTQQDEPTDLGVRE